MPKPAARFDVESVRASWDDAADVYAAGQASGRDLVCRLTGKRTGLASRRSVRWVALMD